MRCPLLTALVLSGLALVPAQAQSAESEVMAATHGMLAILKTRDAVAARALITADTRFTLTRPTPDGGTRVVVMTGEQFVEAVTRPGTQVVEELIRNPVVRIDGSLASVWAEYQVLIDGVVHHCGYDAFHLVKLGEGWKVLNVSDSYREHGCGAPWPAGSR